MPNFIQSYLQHSSIYESPTSFWKWSAYATIAAVLRDNCYLPQGDGRLYPNIYVLFLAESSGHRKGMPVDLSETLAGKLNKTKIISGRASIQAILDELARAETDKKTGIVKKAGAATFYAQELAAGIVSDPEAVKILTDIYDYKTNPYKSRLRTGPCFNLERIVFTMLTASNEEMIRTFFDVVAIKGGMLARTFLVTPNEVREPNSLMRINIEERKESFKHVFENIGKISNLEGLFILEEDAIVEYESWYKPFRKSYVNKKEQSGIIGRIHTSILKIAMLLAANQLRMNICKCDVEEAINEGLSLLPNYGVFTMHGSKGTLSQAGGLLITELLEAKNYILSRKDLTRRLFMAGVDADIDKVMVTLEQAGMIRNIQDKGMGEMYLQLTDTSLEIMGKGTKCSTMR